MSVLSDIGSIFGLTADIAVSFAAAELDPTSANVQAVVDAYARNGQVVPGKMLGYLISLNEQKHPEDLYRSSIVPWLVAGAGLLLFFFMGKRK
jgi:hypothetical protein